jgi:hypothetical protein
MLYLSARPGLHRDQPTRDDHAPLCQRIKEISTINGSTSVPGRGPEPAAQTASPPRDGSSSACNSLIAAPNSRRSSGRRPVAIPRCSPCNKVHFSVMQRNCIQQVATESPRSEPSAYTSHQSVKRNGPGGISYQTGGEDVYKFSFDHARISQSLQLLDGCFQRIDE